MSTHDMPESDYLSRHPELLEELEQATQTTQPPWTIEHRDRIYNDNWLLGIHLYMRALHAAGYPAPEFDYEMEPHYKATDPEENKQDATYRIRLTHSVCPIDGRRCDREDLRKCGRCPVCA